MRVAPHITLDDKAREILPRWSRGRSTPARLVLRAKIVLLAAKGMQNNDIASELGTERTIVGRWRSRFAEHGLAGIEKDATALFLQAPVFALVVPFGGAHCFLRQLIRGRIDINRAHDFAGGGDAFLGL